MSTPIAQPQNQQNNQEVPQAPQGWQCLKWLGPSFLWMLSAAGSGELLFTPRIAALYVPIVTGLTLYLNHRKLPKELRPSKVSLGATIIAGLFFAGFAIIYLLQLTGFVGSGRSS